MGLAVWVGSSSGAATPTQLDEARVRGQIVTVRVYDGDRLAAEGAGVVVGEEGYVLASAAVLDAGPRAAVVAGDEGERAATQRLKEKGSGLGVLHVDGLRRPGLSVSVATLRPGARIFAVTPGERPGQATFVAGSFGESTVHSSHGEDIRLLQHNAIIAARAYGSPVVDECGRLAGVNVPEPGFSIFRARRHVEPEGVVFALSTREIAPRLRQLGIEFVRATDTCVSAETRAREQAREALQEAREAQEESAETRQRAEALDERARQAEADAAASEQEKQEARAAAERARQAAEASRTRAEESQRAAEAAEQRTREAERRVSEAREREEEARQRSERLRDLVLWGGTAGAVLLLGILLIWALSSLRRKRASRQARARAAEAGQEAAAARRRIAELPESAPFDCVLVSVAAGDGRPHALNLRRDALGALGGVIIGRNPAESSHVVTDSSISREHARLYVKDGVLHVCDLGSTNGTALNARALPPGQGVAVSSGDELTFGSVTFQVTLQL